jgi:hypothetical protein
MRAEPHKQQAGDLVRSTEAVIGAGTFLADDGCRALPECRGDTKALQPHRVLEGEALRRWTRI